MRKVDPLSLGSELGVSVAELDEVPVAIRRVLDDSPVTRELLRVVFFP